MYFVNVVDGTYQVYEARISALEKALHQSYKSGSHVIQGSISRLESQCEPTPRSTSTASSTYSIVEGEQAAGPLNELKHQLAMTEQKLEAVTKDYDDAISNIEQLKKAVQQRDSAIADLQIRISEDQKQVCILKMRGESREGVLK